MVVDEKDSDGPVLAVRFGHLLVALLTIATSGPRADTFGHPPKRILAELSAKTLIH
jgi:hypothetical protein